MGREGRQARFLKRILIKKLLTEPNPDPMINSSFVLDDLEKKFLKIFLFMGIKHVFNFTRSSKINTANFVSII